MGIFRERIMRRALAFSFVVATMIIAAPAIGSVVFSGTTLTYGAPGDLGNAASIQQNTSGGSATLLTVSHSLSSNTGPALTPLATFQGWSNVQVVNFNSVTTNSQLPLSTIVANYGGTNTLTFTPQNSVTFLYGYDNPANGNRLAFSGPTIDSDVRVVGPATSATPTGAPNALNEWLNLSVADTGAQGMTAFGACFAHRNDQNGGPPVTDAVIYLSDLSTVIATIPGSQIPATGGTNADAVWFGYEAPAGLHITGIVLGAETTGGGSNNPGMDDLSFVIGTPVLAPEPASLSLLGLGALALLARRRAH
jgi:hypothetical protein